MPLISKRSLRKDRIVHAAARLFAYQGYHGTSTRQIARLANVSELTVFRNFEDKESLFWSTLGAQFAALNLQHDLLDKMAHGEPPSVVLPKILDLFIDTASYRPELLRLSAVAFLEMPPKGVAFVQERLSPALAAISQYLQRSIKDGKIRDLDPTTMTLALTLTALTHPEIGQLIDKNKPLLNHLERSRAQTRFWLDILTPGMPAHPSANAPAEEQNSR